MINVTDGFGEQWNSQWPGLESVIKWVQLFAYGTGPLACLFLSPVAIFEINYSQLIQYEILEKLVTLILYGPYSAMDCDMAYVIRLYLI